VLDLDAIAPKHVLSYPPEVVGRKALLLARLAEVSATPPVSVLTIAWHRRYRNEPALVLDRVRSWARGLAQNDLYVVRSSAVLSFEERAAFEDDVALPMAGWFTSVVGVRPSQIPHAVKECYGSADNDRIMALLASMGQPRARDIGIALIVQRFVDAARCAVLYTRDPYRRGSRDEMLLSAAWGACLVLVSGEVTGDTCRMARSGGPATIQWGDKRWMRALDRAGRLVRRRTPRTLASRLAIGDADADAIRDLGLHLESKLGAPQEVELVWAAGQWIPVQSRPLGLGPQ